MYQHTYLYESPIVTLWTMLVDKPMGESVWVYRRCARVYHLCMELNLVRAHGTTHKYSVCARVRTLAVYIHIYIYKILKHNI